MATIPVGKKSQEGIMEAHQIPARREKKIERMLVVIPMRKAMTSCCAVDSDEKLVDITIQDGSRITTTVPSTITIKRKTTSFFHLPSCGSSAQFRD